MEDFLVVVKLFWDFVFNQKMFSHFESDCSGNDFVINNSFRTLKHFKIAKYTYIEMEITIVKKKSF